MTFELTYQDLISWEVFQPLLKVMIIQACSYYIVVFLEIPIPTICTVSSSKALTRTNKVPILVHQDLFYCGSLPVSLVPAPLRHLVSKVRDRPH